MPLSKNLPAAGRRIRESTGKANIASKRNNAVITYKARYETVS